MHVIAFANEKGGVGKTTTTANFASVAAASGLRVLAVDMDPQANLTVSLGYAPETVQKTIADLISPADGAARAPFSEVALDVETTLEGSVTLLPMDGGPGERLERDMVNNSLTGLLALRRALETVSDDFDVVAIDTPPRLNSPLLMASLVAANGVVGVMEAQMLPARGSRKFIDKVREVQDSPLNPDLRFLGLLLNMFEDSEETRVIQYMLNEDGTPVLETKIPKSKMASKVLLTGSRPVAVSSPHLPISVAYHAMVEEIFELLLAEPVAVEA